jgi:hypothetical protein
MHNQEVYSVFHTHEQTAFGDISTEVLVALPISNRVNPLTHRNRGSFGVESPAIPL